MEYVILGLLMLQPSTLYSLNKAFEQGISLFFSPSLGSIQSAVKRLDEKKWLSTHETVENGRAKKIMTITPEGVQAFMSWMHAPLDPKNLEVSFLSRLFFLGLIQENEQKKALLEGMLSNVKASKAQLDETGRGLGQIQVPAEFAPIFHYQKKVLAYGTDTHAYAIGWIERLIEELDAE